MATKLKYSAGEMPQPVKETGFFCTADVTPAKEKYESGGSTLSEETVASLLAAFSQTAEMVFLRQLMAESMRDFEAGGEVMTEESTPNLPGAAAAIDVDEAERGYQEAYRRYQRAGCDGNASLHYSRPTTPPTAEQYARRQAAHAEACQAFDDLNESRRAIADRAVQHALQHGTDYATALAAIGERPPTARHLPAYAFGGRAS